MENYLDYINNEKRLSMNSIEAYKRDIVQFGDYLKDLKIYSISDINKTTIITYMLYLQKSGRSTSTISRSLASIRCLFQYLLNNSLVKEDPTLNLKSPKTEKRLPNILTTEEIQGFLEQPNIDEAKGCRDKAMLELLYSTGLRVSEILSLNIGDLDFELGFVKLNMGDDTRAIPINRNIQEYLKVYLKRYRTSNELDDPLFINYIGGRLTRQGFWKIIKAYAKGASIKKTITPQVFRNSFAVHLIKKGTHIKEVQEILGHSDLSTTQVYLNMAVDDY